MFKENTIKHDSHTYSVPLYSVGPEGLQYEGEQVIKLCKGSKENPVQTGTLTEHLLDVALQYLLSVNRGELRTETTDRAITNIRLAIAELNTRSKDRKERGVLNTYKK